jgi:ubiquitin-like protein 4
MPGMCNEILSDFLNSSCLAELHLTIKKSSKPPASFTIIVSPTEPIATVKKAIAAIPGGPPTDVQRLLFKGKALADGKLLKEYAISDGETVNIMTKPGFVWSTFPVSPTSKPTSDESMTPPPPPQVRSPGNLAVPTPMAGTEVTNSQLKRNGSRSKSRTHSRSNSANIPELILSPTPPGINVDDAPQPVLLTVDPAAVSTPSSPPGAASSYQKTLSQPTFWVNLYGFMKKEFENREDSATAFEDFLLASKGNLTATQIAAIRDSVGVLGMAGT